MQVDCFDDRGQHGEEDRVLMRVGTGIEQILSVVCDRPVVVLAGTVDARKRFLVEKAHQTVAVGDFAQNLHYQHVVIAGKVQFFEHRSKFELRRSHFIVPGFGGDAEFPEFLFHFGHEVQNAHLDGPEIVVFKLLVLCRRRAEHGSSGLHKIGALIVKRLVDQKIFLFRSERDCYIGFLLSEAFHQPFDGGGESLHGAQQRSFLVESFSGIGAECGRDAERCAVAVTFDERRAGRIPCGIAAGFKCGTESAGWKTGSIRFADDQVFSGEGHDRLAVFDLQKGVVLFGCGSGQRQKPVCEMGRAAHQCPAFHGMGNVGGDCRVKRSSVVDGREQFFRGCFGQILAHGVRTENVFSVIAHIDLRRRFRGGGAERCYCVDCVDAIQVVHGKLSLIKYGVR